MPGSDVLARRLLCALALALAGCSTRKLVVVDPRPCPDGAAAAIEAGCASDLLDQDLIGYWRLDDASGSTMAHDWSIWGNDGTLMGLDPAAAWVAGGPENRALSVDGKGYVQVTTSPSIDSIADRVTITAWIYLDGTIMDFATAISRQQRVGGYGQHYHLSVDGTSKATLYITTESGDQTILHSTANVTQRTWVHLAGTYDGSTVILYVNGAEVSREANAGPFAAETTPVILAGNGNGSSVTELFPGQLDEIMLYRKALTGGQIARLAGGELLPAGSSIRDGGGD